MEWGDAPYKSVSASVAESTDLARDIPGAILPPTAAIQYLSQTIWSLDEFSKCALV